MAVTTRLYREGRAVQGSPELERVPEELEVEGTVAWIDVEHPREEEMAKLGDVLDLHPLAIEDAVQAHQRPKADPYDRFLFLVIYAASFAGSRVRLHELALVIGKRYVVTVRHDPAIDLVGPVHERVEQLPQLASRGSGVLAYAVVDHVVDTYEPVVETLEDMIDELETELLSDNAASMRLGEAFGLKRDVLYFRRAVGPLGDVLATAVRRDETTIRQDLDEELRDVQDHVLRVAGELDVQRELLTSIIQGHAAVVGNRLNQVVLKLSSWAAILLLPTIVAGIYGMNFEHMPELGWRYGYPYALGLMAVGCALLYAFFRRRGWL